LLELILFNQVQFEIRLEKMEIQFEQMATSKSDYHNAPSKLDGREGNYTFVKAFKELTNKSHDIKHSVDTMLKTNEHEISW
jgi:hypothetical protein